MGWAKYYEDNVSICNDRLYMAEVRTSPLLHNNNAAKCNVVVKNTPRERTARQSIIKNSRNSRHGLELRLVGETMPTAARKLQLNGWWWSRSGKCWCNSNTKANWEYAQIVSRSWNARLSVSVSV